MLALTISSLGFLFNSKTENVKSLQKAQGSLRSHSASTVWLLGPDTGVTPPHYFPGMRVCPQTAAYGIKEQLFLCEDRSGISLLQPGERET